ncbi:MAG: hypothetical protein ACE5DN_04420, partial [Flavobacteriales bacterium]
MHSFLLLLIAINCLSCDQKPESKQQPSQQQVSIQQQAPLKAGRVISAVPVRGQAGQSYAFYLPASYDSSNTYPLLIALDPHGKGSLPLEKYKTLADTFNIVIAGSNYSKNGMNFKQSLAHIHLLIQDIGTRIRVDTARLWCMGFSGGARVALNVGALNFGIDAVVLCGAGMPAEDTEEISRLHFIGLAGDADMNYPELYRLNKALNKQGGGNTLITFDGKHEWPPVEEMHSAFIWLQMDYYRRTGLNPPHTVLSKWIARDLSACDSIDNPANRALRYERMIACYSGFTDVFGWKTKKQQIERDPVTIAQRKRMAEIMLAEERAEKNFSEAFIRADLNWWQKQIARLRKTS